MKLLDFRTIIINDTNIGAVEITGFKMRDVKRIFLTDMNDMQRVAIDVNKIDELIKGLIKIKLIDEAENVSS